MTGYGIKLNFLENKIKNKKNIKIFPKVIPNAQTRHTLHTRASKPSGNNVVLR